MQVLHLFVISQSLNMGGRGGCNCSKVNSLLYCHVRRILGSLDSAMTVKLEGGPSIKRKAALHVSQSNPESTGKTNHELLLLPRNLEGS